MHAYMPIGTTSNVLRSRQFAVSVCFLFLAIAPLGAVASVQSENDVFDAAVAAGKNG